MTIAQYQFQGAVPGSIASDQSMSHVHVRTLRQEVCAFCCLPYPAFLSASLLPPFRLHLRLPCIGCGHFKETCNKENNLCLCWKFKRDPKRRVPGVDKKSLPEENSLLTLVCARVAYSLGVRCCMGSQSKPYITSIQPQLNFYCTMGGNKILNCKT